MSFSKFHLEKAKPNQSCEISDLVNLTYRGEIGWTKETQIIQGDRTCPNEIASAISNPNAQFLVVNQPHRLVSCIYVAQEKDAAYIGFFSIHPDLQGKGYGKHVLKQAETYAHEKLGVRKYIMFVVSQRTELIAFYERRGYSRTGRIEAYPLHLGIGVPKVSGLTIEYLEKFV
ncbi:MAG: GNAT family N-acetyltransferase [Nitrosomonas sp.]|nr:GNAT family N-acetyltransferase [Nitrosomonas sp.]